MERQSDGKSFKMERKWLSYDELSTNLKRAALAGEDAGFMNHWGFDFKAIQRAYEKNQRGRRVSGGSTITQQTAKNVFLWPGRSWVRKGFEAYFTVLIEVFWSKQRTLEVYLNVIETCASWGTNENMMFVVGATKSQMLDDIRKIIPNQ
jgi:monofunctional biosynthetic peptidoglycan transglycosylase